MSVADSLRETTVQALKQFVLVLSRAATVLVLVIESDVEEHLIWSERKTSVRATFPLSPALDYDYRFAEHEHEHEHESGRRRRNGTKVRGAFR